MKKVVLVVSAICALLAVAPHDVLFSTSGSSAHQWASPLNLFETSGRASEAEVVTDPSGIVHVFWAYGAPGDENSGDSQAIYYARLEEGVWSQPVDILLSPGGRVARMHSVVADDVGYLHIAWSGANAIFYSRAYGPEAGSPWGWSEPVAWPVDVVATEPAIEADSAGALYLVWTQGNRGLVFTHSEDGGESWAEPETVFAAQGEELARWGRIAVDDGGRIHVVLTHSVRSASETAGRADPHYLYYISSKDHGKSWNAPFLLTPDPDFGEVNVTTYGDSLVHVVWNGRAGRHGRYHRWSQDGGQTWSDVVEVLAPTPRNPIGTGGLTGFPAMATDATGALHVVSSTGGGEYYFRWSEGLWSPPVLLSPGLDGNGVTGTTNSLEQPSIAISEGNMLHVVFHDGFERIWYTCTTIDAPYEEPVALPTAASGMEPLVTAAVSPAPLAATEQEATYSPISSPRPITTGSSTPLLVGILAAGMLVGTVVILVKVRRRP